MKKGSFYESKGANNKEIKKEDFRLSNPVSATKSTLTKNKSISYGAFLQKDLDRSLTTILDASPENPGDSSKKKMLTSKKPEYHHNVKGYTPARLTQGKKWYVSFYAFDPEAGKLKRKLIHINRIPLKRSRKEYADDLILRINSELAMGWTPWINSNNGRGYETLEVVYERYSKFLSKKLQEEYLREKTVRGYMSMLNIFKQYNAQRVRPLQYVYQITPEFCSAFIDYVWLDLGNSGTTRDNYLTWLKGFAEFLVEQHFLQGDPTVAIKSLGKKKGKKNRTVIKREDMAKLKQYCEKNSSSFLLACYFLYYCFIRPKEMSYIRLEDISVQRSTVFVHHQVSKNKQDGVVTIPDKVMKMLIEQDVFKNPSHYFLFGKNFKPAEKRHSDKQFRDFWSNHIREYLKFPKHYKFYSLKDTGITDLIKAGQDLISVRDQARHYSLVMTDIYTPKDIQEANELIKHHSSAF